MPYSYEPHYFEDLEEGQTFESAGRTVTETDFVMHSAFAGDWTELHTNTEYAEDGPFGARIAQGPMTFILSTGLFQRTGVVERLYNSPRMMQVLPDTTTPYATLPTAIAKRFGEPISEENTVEPPTLEERIGDLTYDTDIGNPHIVVEDESWEASGAAVTACPVSAKDSSSTTM